MWSNWGTLSNVQNDDDGGRNIFKVWHYTNNKKMSFNSNHLYSMYTSIELPRRNWFDYVVQSSIYLTFGSLHAQIMAQKRQEYKNKSKSKNGNKTTVSETVRYCSHTHTYTSSHIHVEINSK